MKEEFTLYTPKHGYLKVAQDGVHTDLVNRNGDVVISDPCINCMGFMFSNKVEAYEAMEEHRDRATVTKGEILAELANAVELRSFQTEGLYSTTLEAMLDITDGEEDQVPVSKVRGILHSWMAQIDSILEDQLRIDHIPQARENIKGTLHIDDLRCKYFAVNYIELDDLRQNIWVATYLDNNSNTTDTVYAYILMRIARKFFRDNHEELVDRVKERLEVD